MTLAMPVRGRVVLLTGASRRIAIGAGVARRLVADGAAVLPHSWSPHDGEQPWGADPGGAEALVEQLRDQGGLIGHVSVDFADPDAPARLVDAARRVFGHLDVVVATGRQPAKIVESELWLCSPAL
jgi:3-oxoacyl-[acyl-carrier protein] reductase